MVFWRRANKDKAPAGKAGKSRKARRKPVKNIPTALKVSSTKYWGSSSGPEVFDGATERRIELVAYKGLEQLTIDLRLKSRSVPAEDLPPSDTTPEMPLIMGNRISLSTMSDGYAVTLKDDDGHLFLKERYGDPSKFTRFTVVSDADGTILFCDGVEVARSPKPLGLGRSLRVGAGRKERYWAGEIEYCDVYKLVKVRNDFAGSPDRFGAAGRIASLDA